MKKVWRLLTVVLAFVMIFAFIGSGFLSYADPANGGSGNGGQDSNPDVSLEGCF